MNEHMKLTDPDNHQRGQSPAPPPQPAGCAGSEADERGLSRTLEDHSPLPFLPRIPVRWPYPQSVCLWRPSFQQGVISREETAAQLANKHLQLLISIIDALLHINQRLNTLTTHTAKLFFLCSSTVLKAPIASAREPPLAQLPPSAGRRVSGKQPMVGTGQAVLTR